MRSRFRINAKLYVVTDSLKCNRCCVAIVTVQGAEMFDMRYLNIVGWFGKILQSCLINERNS